MDSVSAPPAPSLTDPALYINRELSWLEFNRRVLEEAQNPDVPLLERLKFLAIFESNLDEFFMVRVGGLQQKVQAGIAYGSGADHMPVKEQLERIEQTVRRMTAEIYRCLDENVLPALEREGIVLRGLKDLTDADKRHLRLVFQREIFPVLTPLAIDPGHPFPRLLNKSLNLAVMLRRPGDEEPLFAVVQAPAVLALRAAAGRAGIDAASYFHAAGNRHPNALAGPLSGHGPGPRRRLPPDARQRHRNRRRRGGRPA